MNKNRKILITGASGLVGTQLSQKLLSQGCKLVVLGRRSEAQFRKTFTLPCDYFQWADPIHTEPPKKSLNVDAIINLMGEAISERWTAQKKKNMVDSRVAATKNLISAMKKSGHNFQAFVSSSAVGYYGHSEEQVFTESSPASSDFLGSLCKSWEDEALVAPCRTVIIRIGVVLSAEGGALAKMLPIFENGLGGKLSNGQQWMSWIHIDDLVNVLIASVENAKLKGPVNAVSPHPVRNSEFTNQLAKVLKVSAYLPTPALALKALLGEMSSIILCSQNVKPEVLLQSNFHFQYPTLKQALQNLFSWKQSKHDRLFLARQWVPRKRSEVFPFFSNEKNLETLTPAFLNFHVVQKSTPQVQEGTEIEYKLKIHGLPVKWKSKITSWKPESEFKDFQLQGPYKKWDHTHLFEDLADGTLLIDRVVYQLPFASFGGNVASSFILKDIKKIFSHRFNKIGELFP